MAPLSFREYIVDTLLHSGANFEPSSSERFYILNQKQLHYQYELGDGVLSVFDYFDYVEYLNDFYDELKKTRIGFSFRSFAQNAGIPSHSYLLRVIKRQRKLSPKYIDTFIKALNLKSLEAQYFSSLVFFNNSNKSSEKEKHLKTILSLRCRCKEEYRLADEQLDYFQHWYYPVIRELATVVNFQDDYALLGRMCNPSITEKQAKAAVSFLVKNKFLVPKLNGTYEVADPIVSTPPEVQSTILRKYHRDTLVQSSELLDTIDPFDRDVSSLTLKVDGDTYAEIKKEIQNFRKRLLHMAKKSKKPTMVCHTGFQLFPRSHDNSGEDANE